MQVVKDTYPELLDLVEDGTLVVVPRPATYVERRTDGYQEPELIFIVGTAHLSVKSAQDVERVVAAVRPENVVVELCKSRAAVMYQQQQQQEPAQQDATPSTVQTAGAQQIAEGGRGSGSSPAASMQGPGPMAGPKASNPFNLSGSSFGSAVARSVSLGGRDALLLRLVLASLSQSISNSVGVTSGGEFVAARVAAQAVDAQVVLGDRPIEITLKRAWTALDWQSRFTLARDLSAGVSATRDAGGMGLGMTQEAVERLKDDDMISTLFEQLSARFPQVMSPLVHERDLYLAWSLKRSKAVNGTSRVVGVVGKGHLRGIVWALQHDSGYLRFRDLVGKRGEEGRKEARTKLAQRVVFEVVLAACLYAAWVAVTGQPPLGISL